MDRVGTYMCLATIPMALLTIASVVAGALLLLFGIWQPVLIGLIAFGVCSILAPTLERLVIACDEAAAQTLALHGRRRAHPIAILSGAMPIAVIMIWELFCFRTLQADISPVKQGALWLWSYGIATGPWTLYAMHVSRFRRTLVGIRAYAGHLAYWMLSILAGLFGATTGIAAVAMLLPAILPLIVGMLLAVADRDALTNVRV